MARTFDPFRDLDRLFGETSRTLGMPLDLVRKGEVFEAHVDLPGVDPASIDIDAEERTLTIRAQRTNSSDDNVQWLVRERPTGTFARQLTLGSGLALDQVDATYADGVLTITIPIAEAAKPRKIAVVHRPGGSAAIEGEVGEPAPEHLDVQDEQQDGSQGENEH